MVWHRSKRARGAGPGFDWPHRLALALVFAFVAPATPDSGVGVVAWRTLCQQRGVLLAVALSLVPPATARQDGSADPLATHLDTQRDVIFAKVSGMTGHGFDAAEGVTSATLPVAARVGLVLARLTRLKPPLQQIRKAAPLAVSPRIERKASTRVSRPPIGWALGCPVDGTTVPIAAIYRAAGGRYAQWAGRVLEWTDSPRDPTAVAELLARTAVAKRLRELRANRRPERWQQHGEPVARRLADIGEAVDEGIAGFATRFGVVATKELAALEPVDRTVPQQIVQNAAVRILFRQQPDPDALAWARHLREREREELSRWLESFGFGEASATPGSGRPSGGATSTSGPGSCKSSPPARRSSRPRRSSSGTDDSSGSASPGRRSAVSLPGQNRLCSNKWPSSGSGSSFSVREQPVRRSLPLELGLRPCGERDSRGWTPARRCLSVGRVKR